MYLDNPISAKMNKWVGFLILKMSPSHGLVNPFNNTFENFFECFIFAKNKIIMNWLNHSVFYLYR